MLVKPAKLGVLFAVFCLILIGQVFAIETFDISVSTIKKISRFTTWQGIEPDKWATLWLIKRHINQDAYFLLVPPNSKLSEDAVAFGVPDVEIRRANRQSMYRRLKKSLHMQSTALDYIDLIIHDVEVNIWDKPAHPHSVWFETMYRGLQARYERDQVPIDCYLAFFDEVSRLAVQPDVTAKVYSERLNLKSVCPGLPDKQNTFVETINHLDVLREISLGKRVVFVDTREDEEFNEVHLPGARTLRLRDVNEKSVQTFTDADLVVPYCVKDFRGFEVAKAIKKLGVTRVATLSPNGLKGWLNADLPVTKAGVMKEEQAMVALMRCAAEPNICIRE